MTKDERDNEWFWANRTAARVDLLACPVCEPNQWQRDMVRDAVRLSRARGLAIPALLKVVWVDAGPDILPWLTRQLPNKRIVVALDVKLQARSLMHLAFHELRHVNDLFCGLRLSRERMEARAEQYATEMMARYQR